MFPLGNSTTTHPIHIPARVRVVGAGGRRACGHRQSPKITFLNRLFLCSNSTGKERDEETGYGYFGARYMDHELMTMWLSVDPMADKYPSISPYAYCAWNPVKLMDPDGMECVPPDNYIINVVTGSITTEASEHNSIHIVGDGTNQMVDFPDGDFSLEVNHNSSEATGSFCSVKASGGTDCDSKMFTMDYYTPQGGTTMRQSAMTDGIPIPEVIQSQSQPFSVVLSLTLIAEVGFSLSIGRYYDGMGNSEWITGASVGIGYDIGVGVSYTHYQPGTSVRDNLGADITGNLGIWYASGNYGILSRSWSIGPSYGLPASASMQFGYTK